MNRKRHKRPGPEQGDQGQGKGLAKRSRRSRAEWVTFSVACAVLALVVGAIATLRIDGPPRRPTFTVSAEAIREHQGRFHLRTRVVNDGEETAENVQVVAELETPGQPPVEAEQVIDFLSGGDQEEVEFVFADDPATGKLEIEVRSFKAR